jgi:SAM-dependent methyltransferase
MDNQEWSEKILKRIDPQFEHRWILFDELLSNSLNKDVVWLDCGAGNNGIVSKFGHLSKMASGLDLVKPTYCNNSVKGDIKDLPFKSQYVDLITLRFVVEHFNNSDQYLLELNRILKHDGKIIILTTNILSPFIFLPKVFLTQRIKSRLLTKIFLVQDNDVFPTHHKLNSLAALKKINPKFKIEKIQYISDLNYTRKWMFLILLFWHIVTMPKFFNKFRTNFLVTLKKV